jgi:hypothetical protein
MPPTAEPRLDREALRQLNLYEVLQVSAKASPEVVHAAYRVLARVYHPDLNPSPNAARMMRQLNAAYKVLSDPERRTRYDAQRAHAWRARPTVPPPVRTTRPAGPPPRTAATPVGRPAVLPITTVRSGWRVGRLIGLLVMLLIVLGAMMFAFWTIAGWLDDEPHGFLRASIAAGWPSF